MYYYKIHKNNYSVASFNNRKYTKYITTIFIKSKLEINKKKYIKISQSEFNKSKQKHVQLLLDFQDAFNFDLEIKLTKKDLLKKYANNFELMGKM